MVNKIKKLFKIEEGASLTATAAEVMKLHGLKLSNKEKKVLEREINEMTNSAIDRIMLSM